jgi:hypothetical protein
MTENSNSNAEALEVIPIAIRFAGRAATFEEQGSELVILRSGDVDIIAYSGDLLLNDFGKLLSYLNQNTNAYATKVLYQTKDQLIALLTVKLAKILGRQNLDAGASRYAKSVFRTLRRLELVDTEGDPTIYARRLLSRWKLRGHEEFYRALGELLLRKGGWTLVLAQLDSLSKGGNYRKKMLHEALRDSLEEKRTTTGIWSVDALVQCLVDLELIKPWDSFHKKYDILWERAAQLLQGSILG